MPTCFFIGHREAGAEVLPALEAAVERQIRAYGVTDFVVGRYGEEYASAQARLESLALEAEDVGETLGALAEELVYDENEAEEVENRLDHIKSLKKKYGASVAEIIVGLKYTVVGRSLLPNRAYGIKYST